jgi:hypothetical protein
VKLIFGYRDSTWFPARRKGTSDQNSCRFTANRKMPGKSRAFRREKERVALGELEADCSASKPVDCALN